MALTYEGKPCRKCGAAERYTSTRQCVACKSTHNANWRETNPEQIKQWRRANPRRWRSAELKSRYGISADEYDALYHQPDGRCAICGKHVSEGKRRLAVDHCHTTGVVRGLLCDLCNRGLGLFRDNCESLIAASSYLKRFA